MIAIYNIKTDSLRLFINIFSIIYRNKVQHLKLTVGRGFHRAIKDHLKVILLTAKFSHENKSQINNLEYSPETNSYELSRSIYEYYFN